MEQKRAEGLTDFAIWEWSDDQQRIPVRERPVYYPVSRIVPPSAAFALGYDIGSETRRHNAILQSLDTDLITASDPIEFVTDHKPGALVFRPVLRTDSDNGISRLAMAVLNWEAILKSAMDTPY